MDVAQLRRLASYEPPETPPFYGQPVEVDYVDDKFTARCSPMEHERMKLVLGVRYNRKADLWIMPATRAQMAGLSGVFEGRLAPTDAARAHARRLADHAGVVDAAANRAIPAPMWYSGPHDPTTVVPYPHMRVLLGGVPSVEPATDEVLAVLLADGSQYPSTEPVCRPEGASPIRRHEAASVRRVREALRQARSSAPGGAGAWATFVAGGDRTPLERGQVGQSPGELGSDDAERAHSSAPALLGFQQTDTGVLGHAGSLLVGSEMGSGKSLLGALTVWLRGGRSLIVGTNTMKYKWAAELAIWAPGVEAIVVDGTAAQRRKQIAESPPSSVLIINYESLRAHTRLAPWGGKALTEKQKIELELNAFHFRSVVVDEAHKIKDPKSQQTMAVKQMGLQADYRLALTGTPILKDPDDAWSIMSFVAPDEWGSRTQFRTRYCHMADAWHGHGVVNNGLLESTREEFDTFFLPRFLRRTKAEVLPDLPEKLPIDYRVIPLTATQAKTYEALKRDMMALTDDELVIAENPLIQTIRLRQVACANLSVENGEVVGLEPPSNKLEAIRGIIADSDGEPLVIYAESRKFIELLERELSSDGLSIGMVTGAQSAAVRDRAVKRFQDGQLDLILGTLGAGAEGITLTRASTIILAQQSWSYGTNAQAIDRVHRIGQTRGVHPIVLISKDTIDEAVAKVDLEKEARLQQLVRDPAWMRAAL